MILRNITTRRQFSAGIAVALAISFASYGCTGNPRSFFSQTQKLERDSEKRAQPTSENEKWIAKLKKNILNSPQLGSSGSANKLAGNNLDPKDKRAIQKGRVFAAALEKRPLRNNPTADPFLKEKLANAGFEDDSLHNRPKDWKLANHDQPSKPEHNPFAKFEKQAKTRDSAASITEKQPAGANRNEFVDGFDSRLDQLRPSLNDAADSAGLSDVEIAKRDDIRLRVETLMRRAYAELDFGELAEAYRTALLAAELSDDADLVFEADQQQPSELVRRVRGQMQAALETDLADPGVENSTPVEYLPTPPTSVGFDNRMIVDSETVLPRFLQRAARFSNTGVENPSAFPPEFNGAIPWQASGHRNRVDTTQGMIVSNARFHQRRTTPVVANQGRVLRIGDVNDDSPSLLRVSVSSAAKRSPRRNLPAIQPPAELLNRTAPSANKRNAVETGRRSASANQQSEPTPTKLQPVQWDDETEPEAEQREAFLPPLVIFAIAVGLGILMGRFIRRRSESSAVRSGT